MVSSSIIRISSGSPSSSGGQGNDYLECLPALYRATLKGDLDIIDAILGQFPEAIKAPLNTGEETILHIAVGSGKVIALVDKLLELIPAEDLTNLKDITGSTTLHVAAATGNIDAVEKLVKKNHGLLYVQCSASLLPILLAARSGHRDVFDYLKSEAENDADPNNPYYAGLDGVFLLCEVINAEFFDLAHSLVQKYPRIAEMGSLRGLPQQYSPLCTITNKDYVFQSGARFNFWQRFIYSWWHWYSVGPKLLYANICKFLKQIVPHAKDMHDQKLMHQQATNLVKCLCERMQSSNENEALPYIVTVMIQALRLGILEVVEIIVQAFPEAIFSWQPSNQQRIFHIATVNRCEKVFNLIYQMSGHKHNFVNLVDSDGNSMLHLAARLAPPHKLNLVSGAALQMQREIQWFKEVEKTVHPYTKQIINHAGKNARVVFTEEHKQLKVDGEKWMKDTANSCTISAALIATVVFAAAITVPGGNESDIGFPIFSRSSAFIIFAVSDAISLFTSTTSLLMFLSILTSRYAEEDFLHALPKRLCVGLLTLFLSILFMMIAFSATVYLVFGQLKAWVLIPVGVFACLPVTSFVLLQFPLIVDVVTSTYGKGIFGKQSDEPFY